jgi:hypothetical protein
LENGFTACLFKPFSISELVAVSDKCLLTSTDKDELPDLSSLLAYGDKRAMLDRLITETGKDMQAVREIMERNDRKALDEWMHRQRSSWAVIRADKPLWNLYELLHQESECSEMELRKCVDAMLRMGTVIIELAQKERRLSDESICYHLSYGLILNQCSNVDLSRFFQGTQPSFLYGPFDTMT